MKSRRPKILQAARDIVAPWLAKLGITPDALAVFEAWDRLLGPECSRARAVGLKGTVLYIEADHSARLHDLTLRKPTLLRRLNDYLAKARPLSDIRFSLNKNQ
jgi:predicted nucleic acid-binding Zn ribbon protein